MAGLTTGKKYSGEYNYYANDEIIPGWSQNNPQV